MKADAKKTLTFLLVAGMAVLVAWEPWRPAPLDTSVPPAVGQKLFPDFSNPLSAKSLEIIKFNEDTASIRDFKVAQTKGLWSIPSHSDYPADANQHMAEAATALMDLKILGLASDRPGDQKEYGVITPDPVKLKVGMTGVGTRITVKDGKDKVLADLVVGKQVKNQPGQHYVRRADRDQIYTVGITTDKLSTKFDDWIEKDLLKLAAFDVRDVQLNDYSTVTGIGPGGQGVIQLDERSKAQLKFDDAKSQWSLVDMTEFDEKGKPKGVTLAEDEEINAQKLNDLKTALDELQIVDVERKPKGLSQDLRATEEFFNNAEAMQSLGQRGFIPAARPGGQKEIFSSEGEATCATKDGVRYVLRFGNLAGPSESDEKPEEGKPPKSAAPNRYLFVTAQFDESQIPKPELLPVPGEKPADDKSKSEEKPADEKPATEKPTAEKPATEKPVADAKSPADKPAEKKPADGKPALKRVPQTKTAAQEAQEVPPAAKAAEKAAPADVKAEAPAAPAEVEAKPDAATTPPAEAKPATPAEEEKLAVERENKRKQDEYDAAIKRGQDKVKELNDRFADWYFIISDDVYKKIHLGRADIIKKKEAPKSDDLPDLKGLEKGIPIGPGAQGLPQ